MRLICFSSSLPIWWLTVEHLIRNVINLSLSLSFTSILHPVVQFWVQLCSVKFTESTPSPSITHSLREGETHETNMTSNKLRTTTTWLIKRPSERRRKCSLRRDGFEWSSAQFESVSATDQTVLTENVTATWFLYSSSAPIGHHHHIAPHHMPIDGHSSISSS